MSTVSVEKETILDLKAFFDRIIEQADMRADRATATVIQPYLPLDQMRKLKAKIDNLAMNCGEVREPIGTCDHGKPVDCEAEQAKRNNVAFPPTDQSLYVGRDHRPQRWVQDGPDDKRDFRRE